jgi:hypothetical protein
MSIKAMKQALEALDWRFSNADAAIEALRQAIEQAEKWDTSDMAHRPNGLTVDVTDLINRAKAEEREACAKLCDGWGQYHVEGDYAAKAIRGRTE